ncbi:unnamed protein product [marine sediment metagenome]|uniref:Uncharacterized protein n=1 Tax=marine sediment metagenome TaxID=412755 RepID=X1KMH9_9ZZZZ
MLVGPGTLLIVGLIGGIGAATTYCSYAYAQQKGPELTKSLKSDLSPMTPEEGPPLPRGLGLKWPGKK